MLIWNQRVTAFLEQHGLPWVVGRDRVSPYAAMQDVASVHGGFKNYTQLYSDQCRRRNRQPALAGKERWVVDAELESFVKATDYPSRPSSLLIANSERIYFFLKLQEEYEVRPVEKPPVKQAHLSHDEIKDRLALLGTYCGWHVFNEVPISGADTHTGTRRPDLCWLTDRGGLWVVDVKTQLNSQVIADMVKRDYKTLTTRRYKTAPERMLLVLPDYTSPDLEAEALMWGYEVMTYDALVKLMLVRVKNLHQAYLKVYEGIAKQFLD